MRDDRKTLVLVVDDDADVLELVQLALEGAGMIVVTARDGQRALALLDFIEPDVIVTDMMMPVLDGFGFLRAYEAWPHRAPVLATSALPAYLEAAPDAGAAEVLQKPFDLREVVRTVRRLASGERRRPRRPSYRALAEESARLRAVLELGLDRPSPEPELREFVDRVAAHMEVPIALISIVTEERQGWTAQCGLPPEVAESAGFPRSRSFCTHAVAGRAALVVQDTRENPLFRENPLIVERGLRFYAGVPIILRTGEAVGTLCIMDQKPRPFSHFDLELLGVFARRVVAVIEGREVRERELPSSALSYPDYIDAELGVFSRYAFTDLVAVEAARGACAGLNLACVAIEVPPGRLADVTAELRRNIAASFVGRLDTSRLGWLVPNLDPETARAIALEVTGEGGRAAAVEVTDYSGGASQLALADAERSLAELEKW